LIYFLGLESIKLAVYSGNKEILNYLLQFNISMYYINEQIIYNFTNKYSNFALEENARNGNLDMIKYI